VQHETFTPQANEIPNQAASWLPGDDYYVNFHVSDPFIKVEEGYARLPGAGYESLHPELTDVDPEDYPDIHKLSILADVAPYSREYNTYRQKIGKQAQGNTELEIEYEKIMNRVKKTRESVIRMTDRHFTAPVDEISGTAESASPGGVTLKEYPGRRFQFSSVSTSAADMSARILGENNNMTRAEVAGEVDKRRGDLAEYLSKTLAGGDTARLVIPRGAAQSSELIRAVVLANGENVNRELIDQGYGEYQEGTSFSLKRHLRNPLPPIMAIHPYIQVYESHADRLHWRIEVGLQAPVRSHAPFQKLRHLAPECSKTAPSATGRLQKLRYPGPNSALLSQPGVEKFMHAPGAIHVAGLIQSSKSA